MPIVLPLATASNAKTFLQLCQLTREKCGISGNGPVSVVNQSGEMLRIINWVQESWIELQGLSTEWGWMREDFSFDTAPAQESYGPLSAGLTQFLRWHTDTLRCYRTDVGIPDEQFLVEWDYKVFRDTYQYASQTPSRPVVFAVHPRTKSLILGPIPEAIYTVRGEYQRAPRPFTSGSDIPELPEQYHMLIVYGAMKRYAFYENAPEVAAGADMMYRQMLSQLMVDQIPEVTYGEPLA
jgi:hypothetical protein